MKKKQQHIEQQIHYPLEHLYTEQFWTYITFTANDLHIVDNWLEHNKKEVTALSNNGNFLENLKHLHQVFGAQMHPVLTQPFEAQMEGIDSFHYFNFNKIRIDCFTIKMVNLFVHQLNLQVIILKENHLEAEDILQLFQLISNKESKLFKVYIQGNPIDHIQYDNHKEHHSKHQTVQALQNPQEFYIKLPTLSHIEFLILRENKLSDEFLAQFVSEFRHHQPSGLKHLDLSHNPITSKGLDSMIEMLSNYNQLVYLGLANISISKFGDIKKLLHYVGRHKIHQDEAQKLQELEQEREAQVQKLVKAKKRYTEDQLPFLPKLSIQDGQHFTYHNPQLQYLNLSENNFGEIDKDGFEKFLHIQQEPFVLIIENNNFEEAQKQRFKKKFKKCVIV